MRNSYSNQPIAPTRLGGILAITYLFIAAFAPATALADPGVSARVEPEEVRVGGVIAYTISAQIEGNHKIEIVGNPDFDNSFRLEFTSDSPGLSIQNGHAQRSLKRTYRLRVNREGNFTITAPQVKLGDRVVTPDPVQLKVVQGSATPQASTRSQRSNSRPSVDSTASGQSAFIEHQIEPTQRPYMGQQLTLTYALFSDAFKSNISPHPPDEPSFDDFWVDDLSQDFAGQRQTVRRSGELVTRTNLRAYALFPLKAGAAQIESLEMDAVEGGTFGRRQVVRLSADPIDIEVRPLPANPPDSFQEGNVGEWKFEVTTDRLNAKMGDPITVRVRAKGSGQVRRLALPALPEIEGFEVAGRQSKTDTTIQKGIVGGTLTDEYTLVPQREGEVVIPELEFGYFDPIEEQYKTQRSTPTPIKVEGGKIAITDPSAQPAAERAHANQKEEEDEEEAIEALLKTLDAPRDTISTDAPRAPLSTHRIFWMLLAFPMLGIIGLGFERPLRQKLNARRPQQGRTKSYHKALATLRDAPNQNAPSTSDPHAALDAIRDAVNIYATEVAQIPAGDVSGSELPEQLKRRGVSAPLADRLGELLQAVQDLRYSPDLESAHTPQEWVEICQNCLRDLEEERRAKRWSSSAIQMIFTVFLMTTILGIPTLTFAEPGSLVQAQTSEKTPVVELHKQALSAQKEGDWERASTLWSQALATHPESVDILFNLGLARAHKNDLGRARLYLERAYVLAPGDRQISRNLKNIQHVIRLHQVEKARGSLTSSTRVNTRTEGLFWWSLLTRVTQNSLAIILFSLVWLLLIAQITRRALNTSPLRDAAKSVSWVLALCVLGCASIWVARAQVVSTIKPAVILKEDLSFRDGPSQHAGLIELETVVVPGVLVPISAESDGWVKLDFAKNSAVWTRADNIRYVAPPQRPH